MITLKYLKAFVTYRCSAECAHCIFNCSPKAEGVMDLGQFAQWWEEISQSGPLAIFEVHGGEPMLYADHVCQMIKIAKIGGAEERWVTTNCSWATTSHEAQVWVERLRDAGATRLQLSTDMFHLPFVPAAKIEYVIDACNEAQVAFRILCACPDGSPDLETTALLDEVLPEWGEKTDFFSIMFAGRANPGLLQLHGKDNGIPVGRCEEMICAATGSPRHPHGVEIDPFGNVLIANGICIGNANTGSLADILSEYDVEKHPIMKIIGTKGPMGLTELPEAEGFELRNGYHDRCQLCHEIRAYLRPRFPDVLKPGVRYWG